MGRSLNVVRPLLSPERLFSVAELMYDPALVPRASGIYGWWFGGELPGVPTDGTLLREGRRLLYIGIAPSAPPRPGRARVRTLRDRIKNHCRGPISTSTLHRSLAALLVTDLELQVVRRPSGKLGMREMDERRLTDWMDANAQVAWMIHNEPWVLESKLVAEGPRLPLNIRGSSGSFRLELKRLRARWR